MRCCRCASRCAASRRGTCRACAREPAPYFRDVVDHLTQTSEIVDSLDGLLSTAFDAHLASISVQQNDDMRKISAGAAIVVVPTLIAGVYGMNFDHMPELHWAFGYPFALVLMFGSSALLVWFFKTRRLALGLPAPRGRPEPPSGGAEDAGAEQHHHGRRRGRSGRARTACRSGS